MRTTPTTNLVAAIFMPLMLSFGKDPAHTPEPTRTSQNPISSDTEPVPPHVLMRPPAGISQTALIPGVRTLNTLILEIIDTMPKGGGYSVGGAAFSKLASAIEADPGKKALTLRPERAAPSFCSGATYLVFLEVINKLVSQGRLSLPPEALAALMVSGQPDGVGIWGRWDANGPGTAKLFHDLGIGTNFVDFGQAKPGDFMKIWWNDSIGSTEKGHSVIFLGVTHNNDGIEMVRFWSSNQRAGFGEKTILKEKIVRVLFSRLGNPAKLAIAHKLPTKDKYLGDMLKRTSSEKEMFERCGVVAVPGASVVTRSQVAAAEGASPFTALERARSESATPHSSAPPVAAATEAAPLSSLNAIFHGSPYDSYGDFAKKKILRSAQEKLKNSGSYEGRIDGSPGPKTDAAIKGLQQQHEQWPTGSLDSATLKLLGLEGIPEQIESTQESPSHPPVKPSLPREKAPASVNSKFSGPP